MKCVLHDTGGFFRVAACVVRCLCHSQVHIFLAYLAIVFSTNANTPECIRQYNTNVSDLQNSILEVTKPWNILKFHVKQFDRMRDIKSNFLKSSKYSWKSECIFTHPLFGMVKLDIFFNRLGTQRKHTTSNIIV